MKFTKYITALSILIASACSKETLNKINENTSNPPDVPATSELPTVVVESAFGTTGTDLAWYASLFTEQSAGTDEQFYDADRRNGITASSLVNNSWNAIYNNLMVLKDLIQKTAPAGPDENPALMGVGQILTAYNLAVVTDMWGDAPWTEALMGMENVHPKYDSQQEIYAQILLNLNNAIANLAQGATTSFAAQDLMYGGDLTKWTKAAWSLKARYFMRQEKRIPTALDSVLACIPNGFSGPSDALIFSKYENTAIGGNPWFYFTYNERGDLCAGETLYNLMEERNDPRIDAYFVPVDDAGDIVPAPNGTAIRSRAGLGDYSYSNITAGSDADATVPTPLMSYHELLFLQAEAQARMGADYTTALRAAIEANFVFHGLTNAEADAYYDSEVQPRLGENPLNEILTQKYIGFYEQESLEVYNDYRRTGIPPMHNPNNNLASAGFPQRFPYPSSEVTANPSNVPQVNIFTDKVWWAQ